MTIADLTDREADYRVEHVSKIHSDLEAMIDEEMQRPVPNTLTLQRLKRRRLLAKEELESWRQLMAAISMTDHPDRAA